MFYVVLVFGVFWTGAMLYIAAQGLRSKSWPLTTGKIIASEVRRKESRHRSRHSHAVSYQPYVRYEYYVAGAQMLSELLAFGDRLQTTEVKAQRIVAGYPAGKSVPVHYNPVKPSQAVLISGNNAGVYITCVFGVAVMAVGICGIVLKW